MICEERTAVDIVFGDAKLQATLESDRLINRRWGKIVAAALKKTLASLVAADTLSILEKAPGKCHRLHGDREGQFALHLSKRVRLIFMPANEPLPTLPEGGLDRERVTRIRVLEVSNHYE